MTSSSTTRSSQPSRSSRATAAEPSMHIGTTSAGSSSGRPIMASRFWPRRVHTSSCTEAGWRSVAWRRPRSTAARLAVGERHEGPILRRRDGQRLDRRTAHRWIRAIGKRAGLGAVHPHMLRAGFIMAALDAGLPLRDVQIAARHADPRTTTIYDRRRENFDRHAAYVVVALSGTCLRRDPAPIPFFLAGFPLPLAARP